MLNTINAIIIDDEPDGRLILTSLLADYCPSVHVLGSFDNAASGIQGIKKLNPDLVFLDIEMPGKNAFGMLEELNPIHFDIIFVTAYDHYALKAIKHNALEYILKPIDKDELQAAVQKYHDRHIASATTNITKPDGEQARIVLPMREGFLFIEMAKIVRCEGDGNYTKVYLQDGEKYVSSKTLKEFEQMLPSNLFLRIHKSHLINTHHVKKYIKGEGGLVVMSDESELEVSRRNKDYFLKHFNL